MTNPSIRNFAVVASRAEKWELAVSLWSQFDDPGALCNLGQALSALNRLDEAIAAYEKAGGHANLGALLIRKGKPQEALPYCDSLNLNVALRQLGRQQEAIALSWARLNWTPPVREVTVACVKWGSKYGADYVLKLRNSVRRHLSRPHSFVCFTDAPIAGIECRPLPTHLKGWWLKSYLFTALEGKILYLDLDTVIQGCIDPLLQCDGLALLETDSIVNECRQGGYNSSIMVWTAPAFKDVYIHDVAHLTTVIYKFDHWLEMLYPHLPIIQKLIPGLVSDYANYDPTAAIVVFPLSPKPHDVHDPWVRDNWC